MDRGKIVERQQLARARRSIDNRDNTGDNEANYEFS